MTMTVDSGTAVDPTDGRHRACGEDIEREAVGALEALRSRARQADRPEPVLLEHVERRHIAGRAFRKARDEENRRTVGHGWMIGEYLVGSADDGGPGRDRLEHRLAVFLLEDGSFATLETETRDVEGPFVECPGWSSGVDFWVQVRDNCTDLDTAPHHRRCTDAATT